MSGVEFHANNYSALVRDELISKISRVTAIGLALFTIIVLAFALPRMRPARSILLCLACVGVLALVHALLLFMGGYGCLSPMPLLFRYWHFQYPVRFVSP